MKTPITIDLELDDYFEKAFSDGLIPADSYIDKSKTGLGMTYSEFYAKRHSIIVIPSLPIIDDKCRSYKNTNPLKVWDETSVPEIKTYILSDVEHIKIVTTPEGFKKIIDAVTELNSLQWLYSNVFCLLDEAHCYATEAFRTGILTPFKYFWKFDRKALGTATPFSYSDTRFNDLRHYKINYKETFGTVTIVNHDKPMEALNHFLINPDMFKGNVHIFFNSVKLIRSAIKNSNIKDLNIFCRNDPSNLETLGEYKSYFKDHPSRGKFKKFNFYSCRYNEGWDLYDDENSTMILVTDKGVKHSLVPIQFKGFQAVGRLRSDITLNGKPVIIKPHMIYHITNTLGFADSEVKSFDFLKKSWYSEASVHVKYRNMLWEEITKAGMTPTRLLDQLIRGLSKRKDGVAEVYPMKVDQQLCDQYCTQSYFNLNTVSLAWQQRNYETDFQNFDINPIEYKGKTNNQINKEVIEIWEDYKNHHEQYRYGVAERSILKLHKRYSVLYNCYNTLGYQKCKQQGFDQKQLVKELITLSNLNQEAKVRSYLCSLFHKDEVYLRTSIKEAIVQIYEEVEWKKLDGSDPKPTAETLKKHGFKVLAKAKSIGNEKKPGLIILKTPDCLLG